MTFSIPANIRPHWNYFLALEKDLEATSRYVEFSTANLDTYSIEFAHLLLSSASEVDTIAKCVCTILQPNAKADNIEKYRKIIKEGEEDEDLGFNIVGKRPDIVEKLRHRLSSIKILVPRYNIQCAPWESWAEGKNPEWWQSYNKVKHERNVHFNKATLRNALNSIAGLLAMNYLYCRLEITKEKPHKFQYIGKSITRYLEPPSTFMRFEQSFYDNPFAELGSYISSVSHDVQSLSNRIEDSD
jgi:hypothetical protein